MVITDLQIYSKAKQNDNPTFIPCSKSQYGKHCCGAGLKVQFPAPALAYTKMNFF